ncbi:hypothetical protein ACROAH_15055 [Shewanella oncorhynchi]|uniref:hypothetical protein n=1 Tax=Shewanella oncorhynchi TaxID=2726434 RepID=UPI003D796705
MGSSGAQNVVMMFAAREEKTLRDVRFSEIVDSATPDAVRPMITVVLEQLLNQSVVVTQHDSHLEFTAGNTRLEVGVNGQYFCDTTWNEENPAAELRLALMYDSDSVKCSPEWNAMVNYKSKHIRDSIRVSIGSGVLTCASCADFWGGASLLKLKFLITNLVSSLHHITSSI